MSGSIFANISPMSTHALGQGYAKLQRHNVLRVKDMLVIEQLDCEPSVSSSSRYVLTESCVELEAWQQDWTRTKLLNAIVTKKHVSEFCSSGPPPIHLLFVAVAVVSNS
eukprot:1618526-Amphidinium_carterae.2